MSLIPAQPPRSRSVDSIERIRVRHLRIMDLALEGRNNIEIANELDMDPGTIGAIINSPLFQNELAKRRQVSKRTQEHAELHAVTRAKQMIEDASTIAAGKMIELVDNEDSSVAFRATKDILDRVLGTQDDQRRNQPVVINAEKLVLLQQVMREERGELLVVHQEKEQELVESELVE
jgi:hypothetical protein